MHDEQKCVFSYAFILVNFPNSSVETNEPN